VKWKQFLKPDWRKTVVFIVLFFISSVLSLKEIKGLPCILADMPFACPEVFSVFFPFPVWISIDRNFSAIPNILYNLRNSSTNWFNLIADIIIWYLLSCLIVWIYDKRKKK